MAKPAGFNINVVVTPADSFWDDVWLKRPIVTSAWSMRPPGEGLAVAYTKDAKWPETHWNRPEYDAMLLKASTTVEEAERVELYKQAGKMLAEEGGLILPMFVHQVLALRKGCSGYEPRAQNFNLNFENLACE
jgi:peptide/nickel transport system substrate-binding protein